MFQPCKFYHFGKKTKTLPQKYIVPQRNERIKSNIKLSDCALFKRVLLFFKCKMFSFESHKIHLLALLGPFTDPNDRFSYPFVSCNGKIPTLSYNLSLKMVPLSGGASLYRPLWRVPPGRGMHHNGWGIIIKSLFCWCSRVLLKVRISSWWRKCSKGTNTNPPSSLFFSFSSETTLSPIYQQSCLIYPVLRL